MCAGQGIEGNAKVKKYNHAVSLIKLVSPD